MLVHFIEFTQRQKNSARSCRWLFRDPMNHAGNWIGLLVDSTEIEYPQHARSFFRYSSDPIFIDGKMIEQIKLLRRMPAKFLEFLVNKNNVKRGLCIRVWCRRKLAIYKLQCFHFIL